MSKLFLGSVIGIPAILAGNGGAFYYLYQMQKSDNFYNIHVISKLKDQVDRNEKDIEEYKKEVEKYRLNVENLKQKIESISNSRNNDYSRNGYYRRFY